jgi:pimeloyl-ACP methyl ester carboxylesterase/aryl carrier-like protein
MTASTELRASEIGSRLVQLWERNLGVTRAKTDDYFKSGGDSLRGTQLLAWIQESFGIELSLLDLFESRTIHAQTRLLLDRLDGSAVIAAKPTTEYMFFGGGDAQLLGALHRPAVPSRSGVVLCYPMGQEYMRIHRTYVELARRLTASRHYALRFDYTGCGDSAGETSSGDLAIWQADIRRAVRELRVRTGVQNVFVIGGRVGANLVLEIAASLELTGVVLWEPIVHGGEYLMILRKAHDDLLRGNAELDGYGEHPLADGVVEIIGYPFTKRLHAQVAALDLFAMTSTPAVPTLVLANTPKPSLEQWAARRNFEHIASGESDGIWLNEDRQNKGVIPARAVQEIVAWIARRDA